MRHAGAVSFLQTFADFDSVLQHMLQRQWSLHQPVGERFAFTSDAAKTIGTDNEFLLFKVFLDEVTRESVKELQPRWINRLAGVDVWLPSHVRTALIYVRWDDKE